MHVNSDIPPLSAGTTRQMIMLMLMLKTWATYFSDDESTLEY
jgi:hypothetical protein